MEYIAVESSQIAAVGFEEPSTLGVRFTPTKKQAAAGEPGSEYHYANVSARTHQALMAAPSIGTYFGQNIKARPDLYPYTKVEVATIYEVPAEVAPVRPTTGANAAEPVDAPSVAITALAVIDKMSDTDLFTPGATSDEKLMAIRTVYLAEAAKLDISTPAKRAKLKSLAFELTKLRTSVEGRAKAHTIDTKRKLALIDSEKRRLCDIIEGIKDDVRRPLTDWENEEKERVRKLEAVLTGIHAMQPHLYPDTLSLKAALLELDAINPDAMQEFKQPIAAAKEHALAVLTDAMAQRLQAEAQAAELAELRRKQAERDEADRKAEAKRLDDERVAEAAKKLADEQVAKAVEAAKVETRKEAIAEQFPFVETNTELHGELPRDKAPITGLHSPAAVEAAKEYATVEDRHKIMDEAVEALMGYSLTRHEAMTVVSAIADGHIPHITITY